jgi:hypothetical protein
MPRNGAEPHEAVRSGPVSLQVSIRLDKGNMRDFVRIHRWRTKASQGCSQALMISRNDDSEIVHVGAI